MSTHDIIESLKKRGDNMQGFTDFLMNNYLWFLVASIILTFALIGYFVDQHEQKKGVSMINKPKEQEVDLQKLASLAQNKSINSAINESLKKAPMSKPAPATSPNNVTIVDTTTNSAAQTVNMNILSK